MERGVGPAVDCFGRHVGDHEAVRGAAKASVRDQGDVLGQACAYDGAGDAEHLAHTGSAAGAFIADDDHVVGLDLALSDSGHRVLFAIEDARGALMVSALLARKLDDAAFGSERPA